MLKTLALAGVLALALAPLAGCGATSSNSLATDIANFNAQVADNLPAACGLLTGADASFQTIVATGKIASAAISAERAAMAAINSICANPGAVNPMTALQTLASAYAAVVEASKAY
jgi:hypothetical protein